MHISDDDVFRHRGELVTRAILDETIVVPISGELANMDDIFSLNETGAFIWERLDGGATVGEIRAGLVERFEVDPEQAERDLEGIIGELLEASLVERAP